MPAMRAPAINSAVMDTLRELDESGGTGLARTLFGLFLQTAPDSLQQMYSALAAADPVALGRAAHGLKSGAANVGAEELSACCKALERLAREQRLAEARNAVDATQDALDQALRELRTMMGAMA